MRILQVISRQSIWQSTDFLPIFGIPNKKKQVKLNLLNNIK